MRKYLSLFAGILVVVIVSLACSISAAPPVNEPTATDLPPATPTQEASATSAPEGVISGSVNYPSEYIPAQRVVAFNVEDFSIYYFVETEQNKAAFSIPVPPGTYYVVSYVMDGSLAGGYSQAVPCGLRVGCDDHSLIPIEVAPGATVSGIMPSDWYAPPGSFPPMP
jgi:hypothetical protein